MQQKKFYLPFCRFCQPNAQISRNQNCPRSEVLKSWDCLKTPVKLSVSSTLVSADYRPEIVPFRRKKPLLLYIYKCTPTPPFQDTYWRLCGKLQQFNAKGRQAERNICDTKNTLWAFVLVSLLRVNCLLPHPHCSCNNYFSILVNFFSDLAPHFLSAHIHQVIWPSPGTLRRR